MKKRIFCLFMSLIVFCGSIVSAKVEYKADIKNAESQFVAWKDDVKEGSSIEVDTVRWEYPITPDDPEWNKLGSVQNKIEACRIPADILDKMSNEQLVQAIMEFPFLIDIFLMDSEQAGVKRLEDTCDAYSELLTRDTAKTSILDLVEKKNSSRIINRTAEEEIKNDALAMLIYYQEDFEKELTSSDVKNLAALSSKIDDMDIEEDILLLDVVEEPWTPSGIFVYYTMPSCNHSNILYHQTLDQYTVDLYNVELVSTGSCKYNCHSYAWHSQSTSNKYWINNPVSYLIDPVYSRVLSGLNTSSMSAGSGDIVFYGTQEAPSHSALLIQNGMGVPLATRYVHSKWGTAGVFRHTVANVPGYDTVNISVWSR